VRPGALALLAEEDRELTLIALVTMALSRDHFAGDAVRPCSCPVSPDAVRPCSCPVSPVAMLPLGVVAILVLGVEGVVVGLLRLGLRVRRATLLATLQDCSRSGIARRRSDAKKKSLSRPARSRAPLRNRGCCATPGCSARCRQCPCHQAGPPAPLAGARGDVIRMRMLIEVKSIAFGMSRYSTRWHLDGATWTERRAAEAVKERDAAAAAASHRHGGVRWGGAPTHANPGPAHGRHELRCDWRVLRTQPRRTRASG
jgi:hypothetical protein